MEPVGSTHGTVGQGIDPVEKDLGAGAPLAPQDEVAAYGPLMAHLVDLWKARHRAWLWFGAFWPWLQWLQWNQPKWPNAWSCGEGCRLLLGLGLGGRGLGLRLGLRLGHLGVLAPLFMVFLAPMAAVALGVRVAAGRPEWQLT